MAVRFDASTDRLTGGGITGTVGTVTCWFRVAVDRDAFSNAWVLWNSGTTGLEAGFGTNSDGTSFLTFDSAFTTQTGPNVTVGTWYCMGLVMNGTSWTLYYGTDPGSLTTVGPTTMVALSSPGGISVSDPSDWLNGDIANFKVWARALSAGDVAAELATYSVVDSTSLVRVHTFQTSPGTTNGAGSGGDLTAGSTATTTSTGPAALDTLFGDVSSAITAGATVTGTVDSFGDASSAITAGSTITGLREDVGDVSSVITAGSSVVGTAESFGDVSSTITAGASVVGEAAEPTGDITSTITAGSTVTGTAESFGDVSSTITASSTVTGTADSFGAVSSSITAGSTVTGVDLNAPTFTPPLRVGSPVLAPGLRAAAATLAAGPRVGTPT